jgi:hypothetical protein
MDPRIGGLAGEIVALLVGLGICAFLLRGGRDQAGSRSATATAPPKR